MSEIHYSLHSVRGWVCNTHVINGEPRFVGSQFPEDACRFRTLQAATRAREELGIPTAIIVPNEPRLTCR